MITRRGSRDWSNVHLTEETELADLIFVDNSTPPGSPSLNGFDLLTQIAKDINGVIQDAKDNGKRVRALGSGWALSDIAITDGYLINTKLLNGCFDVADKYFHANYPEKKRDYVVVAQCGASIGEINVFLEVTRHSGILRALKTAGIGAGQTVVGSFSGNTHGSAIRFGSSPDYVVGIQLATGRQRSLWIERASYPVMADEFADRLDCDLIRDDDVFEAALVSFGAFGVITSVAIETRSIYHLEFPPVRVIGIKEIKARLGKLSQIRNDDNSAPYHYEFVFNPYDHKKALEASAKLVPYKAGHPTPKPVWIVRTKRGFTFGDKVPISLLRWRLIPAKWKAAFLLRQYQGAAILDDVRGTPGQLFTATIFYFEGYTESAIAVSIDDAARMIDISSDVIKQMRLPTISQVRLVHPTGALLGFTKYLPKTAVFEWGLINDSRFKVFEKKLTDALNGEQIRYALHWSKNSGVIDAEGLSRMYGDASVKKWREARKRVFGNDAVLMAVFNNPHLERAGLV